MGKYPAILGGSEWMDYLASFFEPRVKKGATEGQPIVLDDDAATSSSSTSTSKTIYSTMANKRGWGEKYFA